MLDILFSSFGSSAIHRTAMISSVASNVSKAFDQEFAQDHSMKQIAIDSLIKLLEQYRSFCKKAEEEANAPKAC